MCSTGCPTQDHPDWGSCIRSKGLKVAYCGIGNNSATKQKRFDAELSAYRSATAQGIQPAGTQMHQIRAAVDKSDAMGAPFRADVGGVPA